MEEYRTQWQTEGWQLIIIGPTSTWRQEWGEWDAIRDMEEIYHMGITWSFLKPLLIDMVVVPEHLKPSEDV